jgi:hypothetical protein
MTRTIAILALAATLALAACGEEEPEATDGTTTTAADEPTATTTAATTATGGQTAAEEAASDGGQGAGGGDDGGESAGAPAATAEQAISAVLTADGDPAQACTDFVTQDFVVTAYGGRANCIAARRPSALAESLRISDEGGGTFTVVPKGGPYDGVEVTVEIVDDGGYRVSSLLADIPAGP